MVTAVATGHGNGNNHGVALNFSNVLKVDVPMGRHGKHRDVVSKIWRIWSVQVRTRPCAFAGWTRWGENADVRLALTSHPREAIDVATSTDDKYLYRVAQASL